MEGKDKSLQENKRKNEINIQDNSEIGQKFKGHKSKILNVKINPKKYQDIFLTNSFIKKKHYQYINQWRNNLLEFDRQ